MPYVTHWDEVERRRLDVGALRVARQDLGRAAGMSDASVKRMLVDPGARPSPVHAHGRDEEMFFVLAGRGLSWQDGVTHEVGPGDCMLHPPEGPAHTLIAGDEGIDVLAFGPESMTSGTRLPRAGVFWHGPWWIDDDGGPERPFAREPEAIEATPGPRPPTTIHFSEGIERVVAHGPTHVTYLDAGRAMGSRYTGLRHATIAAGHHGPPLHVHSAEHEIFVVLEGTGTLLLGDETFDVRRGSVVGRPAGTGVAHQFRAGDDPLSYLAWSTRDPNDLVHYPRSGKVSFRGLGVVARIEQVDYWDGE